MFGVRDAGFPKWLVLTCALADCGSDEQRSTCLMACNSGVVSQIQLSPSFAQIQDLTLNVCLNDTCFAQALADLPEAPSPGGGVSLSFPDGATIDSTHSAQVSATLWNESGGYVLEIAWIPWSDRDLHDGDHFRATLIDASGSEVASFDRFVGYSLTSACGDTCHYADYRGQ